MAAMNLGTDGFRTVLGPRGDHFLQVSSRAVGAACPDGNHAPGLSFHALRTSPPAPESPIMFSRQ